MICALGDIRGDVTVFCAHSDTVFPDEEPYPLRREGNRIFCPGIGDDTANVVCMLLALSDLLKRGARPKAGGVIFAVDSGEEGLGNLRGCRKLMDTYGARVKEFIAFDLGTPRILHIPVGSKRFRVTVKTEGGHSFSDFGKPNAIEKLAGILGELYALPVPAEGKTTYNVGKIEGGTSVNTVAQSASMLFEYRSDSRAAITAMEEAFFAVLERHRTDGVEIGAEVIGDRPTAFGVDAEKQAALLSRVQAIVERHTGEKASLEYGSTDCNIPASMGIPSLCLGCIKTGGTHTREEYVEADSLEGGVALAKAVIGMYFEE